MNKTTRKDNPTMKTTTNTTQHTPGPWRQAAEPCKAGARWAVIVGKDDAAMPVAKVLPRQKAGNRQAGDFDEENANARLIASAPDLLSALRAIVEHDDSGRTETLWTAKGMPEAPGTLAHLDCARAAIAKATGGE